MENKVIRNNRLFSYNINQVGCRSSVLPNIILTCLLALVGVSPYFVRNLGVFPLLSIFVLWFATLFLFVNPKRFFLRDNVSQIASIILLLLCQAFYLAFGITDYSPYILIERLVLLSSPLIFLSISEYYNKNEKHLLFFLFFFIICINIVDNIRLFYQDNSIFESLAISDSTAKYTNAGETNFVAFVMLFSLSAFLFFLAEKKIVFKIVYASCFALGVFFIAVINSRTTSLLLLLFGVLLLIFFAKKKKISFSKILITIIILFIIFMLFRSFIFEFLIGMFKGSRSQERLEDLSLFFNGQSYSSDGSFSVRMKLAQISFESFSKNPFTVLFGMGEHDVPVKSYYYATITGIGGHSQIIDYLAQYGIVGFSILVFYFYENIRKSVRLSHKKSLNGGYFVIIIVFFLYGLFNIVFYYNMFFVIFVLVPVFLGAKSSRLQ